MIGSPNYGLFVYDGDGDTFGEAGPDGSAAIEELFETYYADRSLPSKPTAFDGRSDYLAFIDNDIPAGGLFTGAEDPRPTTRWRSGAARRARPTTPATTRPATTSTTSA